MRFLRTWPRAAPSMRISSTINHWLVDQNDQELLPPFYRALKHCLGCGTVCNTLTCKIKVLNFILIRKIQNNWSNAPIQKRTFSGMFSSDFQLVLNRFRIVLVRFCSAFCVFSASSSSRRCFWCHRWSIDKKKSKNIYKIFEKNLQSFWKNKLKNQFFLIL